MTNPTNTTRTAPRPTGARPTTNNRSPQSSGGIPPEDVAAARLEIARAFEISGLISDGRPVCPNCGTSTKGKIKLRQTGAYTCYRCGKGSPDNYAITLLAERLTLDPRKRGDLRQIVEALLGRSVITQQGRPVAPVGVLSAEPDFKAIVDTDVYHAIRDAGSVHWAQKFYGRFHISADAVTESGCVVLEAPEQLQADLLKQFGRERLIACGVLKEGVDGKRDWFLFNKNYPVVEPHRLPNGDWVGLQFRGSRNTERRVREYPALKEAYDARKQAYEAANAGRTFDPRGTAKPRHVPKFLSLQGGVVGLHLIGMGLPAIAAATPGKTVYIVEGMKDMLAARTLGVYGYAIPGTNHLPPEVAMDVLVNHRPRICTDGDEAGAKGAESLRAHFEAADIRAGFQKLPDGLDVTDVLIRRNAQRGCDCEMCTAFRVKHPDYVN